MHDTSASDAIPELVRSIDDNPDRLHADVTPSVRALTELGLPAALAVLPLLDDAKQLTRMRAFRVLGNVVMRHHGWQRGRGYADPAQERGALSLMEANGAYDPTASPGQRQEAIARWRDWLEAELAGE